MNTYSSPGFHGATQTISVWAPAAERMVHLVADGVKAPMKAGENGWWHSPEPVRVGSEYAFSIDGGDPRPDPRSLLQPEGIHGPSEVVDLAAHDWQDDGWRGHHADAASHDDAMRGAVFYELHIGTFTESGTFDSAIERLDHLVTLGVTHVEILPVNGVPGERNWGYDGVNWYATSAAYGGPAAFQRFVDACHARGLAVCLDVVYNHLGPSGNYLPEFGPYFNALHHTPWGPAVNLDGPQSDEVRRFIIENALMWFTEFHVDAFRLDAVHALADDTAVHILEELTAALELAAEETGRNVVVVAESDRNDPATVTPRAREPRSGQHGLAVADGGSAGLGLSGQWADDIHHTLHVLLTGETQGYYEDFAAPAALAKMYATPFFHDGTYSSFRERRHGRPVDPEATPAWRFVASLQTHDQVGNRATGERLSQLVGVDRLACAAALLLTSPYTPMLFMGEEYGAQTPWQFFTDHVDPEIAEGTSRGRAAEFAAHGWGDAVPDPQEESTFRNSVLRWSEIDDPDGEQSLLLDWYRTLIRLRREVPDLSDPTLGTSRVERDGEGPTSVVTVHRGDCRVVVNLSGEATTIDADRVIAAWHIVDERPADGGGVRVVIPADGVAIVR
ncbi:malto-oligosyltrehalose trehalohydrolase [uncultured Dermacoccus sp.]|uniref:malto-oligosyltrehalose trehalohydrolase n=1 Tax=uncultured Dermacoccus sp. TaxID=339343 RepID=UPI002593C464|nr:malto-oligosyltrehalose trehalohydrolase [uncultured Dermacoccus sp.]